MPESLYLRAWESDPTYPKGPLRDSTGAEPGTLTLTAMSVITGTTAGGTSTNVTGTNLYNIKSINLGGNEISSWTWNSSSSITIVTPAHSAGAVSLVVTQNNGVATTRATAFTYA